MYIVNRQYMMFYIFFIGTGYTHVAIIIFNNVLYQCNVKINFEFIVFFLYIHAYFIYTCIFQKIKVQTYNWRKWGPFSGKNCQKHEVKPRNK